MAKGLVIITGAGASYDLVPSGKTYVNADFKPPLSKDLFHSRNSFTAILDKYPKARALSGFIKIGIENNENFETILKDLESKKSSIIQQQLLQIPLYVQELIGEVSQHYTNDPLNYNFLIAKALQAGVNKIIFITLNYDTFIEKSIRDSFGGDFSSIESYCNTSNDWMLLKLHGSVNWGHPINSFTFTGSGHEDYLKIVNTINKENIGKEIILLENHQNRFINNIPYYPAIVMPIEGKYEYICPENHSITIKEAISEIENFLIVGSSGQDKDLVDFLNASVKKVDNLHFIGVNSAEDIFNELRAKISGFSRATSTSVSSKGFSASVLSKNLDFFMDRISKN